MLRGTRIIDGQDAVLFNGIIDKFRQVALANSLSECIVPAIWEAETFDNKVGPENTSMMWRFEDKGNRKVCLIPEVTGIFQERFREKKQPERIFYIARCYRYERPQLGRYREFTQFGVEFLGNSESYSNEAENIMRECFRAVDLNVSYDLCAKRGLSYYDRDGFEAKYESLGAQKQLAGGGRYAEGVGFAIGVDRTMLAIKSYEKSATPTLTRLLFR